MEAQQSAGMADLAARLTKRLADANSDRNLVFSPLSIHAVLALLAAGAGGDTLEEILRVLGARSRRGLEDSVVSLLDGPFRDRSSEPDGGGPTVAFACGVWSDLTRPLKPAFRDAVVGKYKAEASSVNFHNDPEQARAQINAWAAAATGNLIDSAVPRGAVHRNTDLVLANAIYFRGKWEVPFHESSTKNRPFYRLDGTAVDVPFMSNHDRHFISEHDGFKVLQLGYKSSSRYPRTHGMSMCIFLPHERDGLASLLDKITSSSPAGFLSEHLPTSTVSVGEFGVPKFELSSESSLVGVLNDLGLRLPFTHDADLSGMLEDDLPYLVQDVFQKAVIQVDEEGTTAAAVTMSCFYSPTCPPDLSRRVDFVADHPFAYLIVEEASHAVLFVGHVVDPGNGAGAVIPSPAPFQERATTKREPEDEVMNKYSAYGPVSPVYKPLSPVYDPVSPVDHPYSPAYRPTSPVYHQYSPAYSPYSPAYNSYSSVYSPTSPAYNSYSPAYNSYSPVYSPVPPAYQPVRYSPESPTCSPVPYGPQYEKLPPPYPYGPEEPATGEDELPAEKAE